MKQGNGLDLSYSSAVAFRQFESKLLSKTAVQHFASPLFLSMITSFSPDAHAQQSGFSPVPARHRAAQVQQNRTATKNKD